MIGFFTKRKYLALLIVLALVMLTGCSGNTKSYEPEDYMLELDYKEDFRILQLCDIHVGNKDNRQLHLDFLNLTIEDANADLIVLDGDLFTFADKATAIELFDFIDSYGVPWTVTFGNHDEQCYFSVTWLTAYLNNYGSNCIFLDIQDDDVTGNANFAINLMEDGSVRDQVIIMDSNRYNFSEYIGYDYIKENQIEWYEKIVNYTTFLNNGSVVPSLLYFHIPIPEFADAWEAAEAGSADAILEYGTINEGVSCPDVNSGLFDRIQALGSTKAVLVGHDHVNNFRILYKGVYLIYGLTSTDRIYCLDDMMGGHVTVIHDDHSLSFEHIYHTYEEVR